MEDQLNPDNRAPLGSRPGRRAVLAVAGGTLLAVLGFNAVSTLAADPTASPSAGDQQTQAPSDSSPGTNTLPGTRQHRGRGDCPADGSGGSGGRNQAPGGGTTPQQPTPSEEPQQPSPSETPES